jgi:hypothetical protein
VTPIYMQQTPPHIVLHSLSLLQVSNWESRPLRDSQLHYASLDAHSQLALLDALSLSMGGDLLTGVIEMYKGGQDTHSALPLDGVATAGQGGTTAVPQEIMGPNSINSGGDNKPCWMIFTRDRGSAGGVVVSDSGGRGRSEESTTDGHKYKHKKSKKKVVDVI